MNLKTDYLEFQKEISKRGIEYLIHFTATKNLYSILEQGKLMSREMLESSNIDFILDYVQFTDKRRYDDKSFINLSISAPNSFLFDKFKELTKDGITTRSWCILKIDPKYIYEKETRFSVANATSKASNRIGITGDIAKFKLLFADNINIPYGVRDKSIAAKFTTNVQAEVLVKNEIPVESIIEVCFETRESLAETKAALSRFNTSNFVVDSAIFSPKYRTAHGN